MVTVRDSALESMADLALAVIHDRGDAPFVWCHFPYVEYEGRTKFREFGDGSVLALDTDTGQWMAPWQWDMRHPVRTTSRNERHWLQERYGLLRIIRAGDARHPSDDNDTEYDAPSPPAS